MSKSQDGTSVTVFCNSILTFFPGQIYSTEICVKFSEMLTIQCIAFIFDARKVVKSSLNLYSAVIFTLTFDRLKVIICKL